MKKRIILIFMLVFTAFYFTACKSSSDNPVYFIPPSNSTPAETGTLRLYNASGVTIDHAYLSPATSSTWGTDQLSSPLPTGSYFDIVETPIGTYDSKATVIGAFSTYYGYLFSIPITKDARFDAYANSSSFTGSLKIVNGTVGAHIVALYVSPSSVSTWGSNQISSHILPAGYKHLTNMPTDDYDVKCVWDVGPDSFYYSNSVTSLSLLTLDVI